MHLNMSDLIKNDTLCVNESETANMDFYEAYKTVERDQTMTYRWVAYVIGTLIVLSNVIVVVSSGLLLRKGKEPKSTYMLLGNVSLADTIVGFSLIFAMALDNAMSTNLLCVFQIGLLVCPAMVSIFSVGFIAVDRYIFILHGLYYQRWFNTKRVRIGILCIWIISVTLGFLPATGWTNTELIRGRCYYVALFPGPLILLNSLLSIVPIIVVAVLYSVILVRALKNVDNINSTVKVNSTKNTKLRIYRGTISDKKLTTYTNDSPAKSSNLKIKRSASFGSYNNDNLKTKPRFVSNKSKSIDDSVNDEQENQVGKSEHVSAASVYTIESNYSDKSSSANGTKTSTRHIQSKINKQSSTVRKIKEPNKWRAVTIVLLTSGSFIITWMPFFIAVIFFVFCEEKLTNPKCLHIRSLLGGPLATLAFFNSILNPLIYAWWHKGFQRSVSTYYRKYVERICIRTNKEIVRL